jgi:SWI/SNF-related matrix-associated actin-dependent regulator 1 of chromatin subfamily A
MHLAPEIERDVAPPIWRAIQRIAARSNYATPIDGAGFNTRDAELGHKLAEGHPSEWSPKMLYAAWTMCRRYRGQLAYEGIEFGALPEPANPYDGVVTTVHQTRDGLTSSSPLEPSNATTDRRCRLVRARAGTPLEFAITFGYHPGLVKAIKLLPERTWEQEARRWVVPASAELLPELNVFLHSYGFHGDADTVTFMQESLLSEREKREQAEAMAEMSRATTSGFDVATLAKFAPDGSPQAMRDFQRVGAEYAVRAKRTFIGDEQGLGKTVQGIATVEHLEAFPCLVICKNSLKPNWHKELTKWVPHRTVSVLGATPDLFAQTADFTVINYEALSKFERFLQGRQWAALIVDESQKLKSRKALRTTKVRELVEAQDTEVRLFLTGTPLLNRPGEFVAQLEILGWLEAFGGAAGFKRTFVNGMRLKELNDKLRRTCYVRRLKTEVLTELPPKVLAPTMISLTNSGEYDAAEDDVISWIERHAAEDVAFLATLAAMPEPLRKAAIKEHAADAGRRAARAEALVRINALKYIAVKGKLAGTIDWINDFLESGEKLVFFAERVEIQRAIAAEFPGCATLMAHTEAGRPTSAQERQFQVDRFQTDPDCKLIVCGLDVGGEGWTLTAASNVALLEFGWTPGGIDQAGDRCHRIGQTDSVTVWHLLAEGTIDEWVMELIDAKRKVVSAATDGREVEDFALLTEIMKRLLEKRRTGAAA